MNDILSFFKNALINATQGGWRYHLWMFLLTCLMGVGAIGYTTQVREGMGATAMNDIVSWGLYISNFTFLVGLAAAAVMLVLPTYILKDVDFKKAVLIGEGVAVAALIMCLAFVTADLGGPHRIWHMMPVVGYFNWPDSMLTWDVLVLNGYLMLNLGIPFYILFSRFQGREPNKKIYVPLIVLSVFWAVGIHLVTAFLYAGLPARPFWNNALLGPRFLASAFCAGPSFIILVLAIIRKFTEYEITQKIINKLALIITVSAQINLVMLGSELFKEFYHTTHHSIAAEYLFFGIGDNTGLVPWIWTSITLNILCTFLLTLNPLRKKMWILYPSCALLFIAVWIEKGMGLIIPGLSPSPMGEIYDYLPSWVEVTVSLGIWALGLMVLTVLIKVALPIEMDQCKNPKLKQVK